MTEIKKILVADDEAGIRNLLFDLLSDEGFNVTLAKDGQESLDRMEDERFDLLITDINMPRIDGVEVLRRMKKAGRLEKVIVMSGRPSQLMIRRADIPEVIVQLRKPFPATMLLEVIASASVDRRPKARRASLAGESEMRKCSIN
jgi:CheY-like chemotaxis protein